MLYAVSFVEKKDTKLFEEQFRILSGAELNDYAAALLSMAARNIGDNTLADRYIYSLKKNVQDFGEGGAYWGGQAWHYNWQDDKVQTTAMAVKALIADPAGIAGNSELLNKAIRWLLMQRHGGGWNSTQETAFIVYAIVDYLKNSKELDPDYDVRIFLNNQQVLEKHMRQRTG